MFKNLSFCNLDSSLIEKQTCKIFLLKTKFVVYRIYDDIKRSTDDKKVALLLFLCLIRPGHMAVRPQTSQIQQPGKRFKLGKLKWKSVLLTTTKLLLKVKIKKETFFWKSTQHLKFIDKYSFNIVKKTSPLAKLNKDGLEDHKTNIWITKRN